VADLVKVLGVKEIKESLRKADVRLGVFVRRGMIKAGLQIQRYSQKIVPIDTANLKNSAGTRAFGSGWATEVIVFYTAEYAVFVHEMTWLKHKPGKEAKFLEKPAREKRKELLQTIANEAKLFGRTG